MGVVLQNADSAAAKCGQVPPASHCFAVKSIDFVLKDIFEQIKAVSEDQKDASYAKLLELLFKGIDLKQKIIASTNSEVSEPQCNFIKGLDPELI
ncbi:MAG: hypothetical protein V2B14_01305 [bacterium]